jgi:hypothetical protein
MGGVCTCMQHVDPARVASVRWLDYFGRNARSLREAAWSDGARLSAADRFVIASSIRTFQRGEEGSGRTIARFARRYAERTGDLAYPAALQALFDEEARHAEHLGRFIDLAGIPRLKSEFSDGAFRFLRHRMGLDGALCLLVTAESIACVYYRALYAVTSSPLLREICAQILRDETQHVRFQSQRIELLRRSLPRPVAAVRRAAHAALFAGAAALVALRHGRVLAAGLGPRRFLRLCRLEWRVVDRFVSGNDAGHPTRLSRDLSAREQAKCLECN